MEKNEDRIGYFDVLRGLAVLGVIAVHTPRPISPLSQVVLATITQGARGVQLFFMVSAMTIFLVLDAEVKRKGSVSYPAFFTRRFFRLAPLYYLAIVVFSLYSVSLLHHTPPTSSSIIANFLFIHSINPYWINTVVSGGWSIGIECLFYMLVPFLYRFIRSKNDALLFLLGSIVFSDIFMFTFSHLAQSNDTWREFISLSLPAQLPIFALGILLYMILLRKDSSEIKPTTVFLWSSYLAIFLVLRTTTHALPTFNQDLLPAGAVFFCLIYWLSKVRFQGLPEAALAFIGTISYTLYFVHFLVIDQLRVPLSFLQTRGLPPIIQYTIFYALVVLASIPIAYGVNRLIEKPFIAIGKRFSSRLQRKQSVLQPMSALFGQLRLAILPNRGGR